jgi:hypothetical protein
MLQKYQYLMNNLYQLLIFLQISIIDVKISLSFIYCLLNKELEMQPIVLVEIIAHAFMGVLSIRNWPI